jgi:uncharacterized protein YodC (DUF2158 family)
MRTFKVGDVVMLKSGGPHMTIEAIQPDGSYTCIWFDKSQQKSANFNPAIVTKPPREKPPNVIGPKRR